MAKRTSQNRAIRVADGKRRVAIFDIDGTIFRSSLLIEVVSALIHEGVFRPSVAKTYEAAHVEWLERKGSYDAYINAVVKVFETHLRGVRYEDYYRASRQVIHLHHARVYRYTRDLVAELSKKGYCLLAISNSPVELVKGFCEHLGFTKIYGRIYEVDGRGRFNGRVAFLDLISDKAKIFDRAVMKEGLTLKGSVGVGDTESDIPFLKMVDRPICFNPNAKLYKEAVKRKWEVVVERKNVIYRAPRASGIITV